ncbi:ATP-binding protein [Streptomyces sp. NPDC052051]|uniref:ATP-binding protein n=1 Tax=Streptomyces sp. NPDC052051 TaxID=3154649 RepID=UPI00344A865E
MNSKKPTQLLVSADHFNVLLSSTPRGARLARLLAADWLRTRELPCRIADAAERVVAELTANAATHGRLPGRDFRLVLLRCRETVRIEVTDTRGDDLPRRRSPAPDAESGRGLLLVEAFADRWGVELGPVPRKTVWAELDLPPGPAETAQAPEPGRVCSGAVGGLPQGTREGKEPNQAPPPPARSARSLARVNITNSA